VLKSRSLVCLKTGSMLKTCNNMNLVLVMLNKQRNASEWTRWGREAKSLSFVENRTRSLHRNGYKTKLNLSSRCYWESSVRFLRPEEPIRSSNRKTFFLMKYDRSNQWDSCRQSLSALDTILLSDWPIPMKYDRVILFSLRCRWRMGIPGNDSDNGLINPFIHPTGINFLQWLDNENRAKPDFWVIN
jgi:hypothetical protein